MNIKKALNAYTEIDNNLTGADFEKKWFESVIMVLNRIQSGNFYNQVEAHVKLIEICNGLQWIQENLNEKLNSQHITLLKQIYSLLIQIINGALEINNMAYLSIVIASLKTVLEPYYENDKLQAYEKN